LPFTLLSTLAPGGPAGIAEAESVFHADREAVLAALSLSQESDIRQRFGIAWSGLHTLFVDYRWRFRQSTAPSY
jgi:hypothetical protein